MRSGALRDSSELLRRQRVGSRRSLPFPPQPPPPFCFPIGSAPSRPRARSQSYGPAGGWPAGPPVRHARLHVRVRVRRGRLQWPLPPLCLLCVLARRRRWRLRGAGRARRPLPWVVARRPLAFWWWVTKASARRRSWKPSRRAGVEGGTRWRCRTSRARWARACAAWPSVATTRRWRRRVAMRPLSSSCGTSVATALARS